jgi:predicted RNase H-like HicB family nuclease
MTIAGTGVQTVRVDGNLVIPVVLTPGEDGFVVATCPILPGCITQGGTREEALANMAEAAQLTLDSREDEGWDLPAQYEIDRIVIPS